jgi:hypothetical protein
MFGQDSIEKYSVSGFNQNNDTEIESSFWKLFIWTECPARMFSSPKFAAAQNWGSFFLRSKFPSRFRRLLADIPTTIHEIKWLFILFIQRRLFCGWIQSEVCKRCQCNRGETLLWIVISNQDLKFSFFETFQILWTQRKYPRTMAWKNSVVFDRVYRICDRIPVHEFWGSETIESAT